MFSDYMLYNSMWYGVILVEHRVAEHKLGIPQILGGDLDGNGTWTLWQ